MTHPEEFEGDLEYERWAHAGCLTLAEGSTDYPPERLQSPAMKAIIKLRKECERLKKLDRAVDRQAKSWGLSSLQDEVLDAHNAYVLERD